MDIYKMYLNDYSVKKIAIICNKTKRYVKRVIKQMRAMLK